MMTILASPQLSELLSQSTGPLVLISGIGLVLLVINARFLHVTDRLRSLLKELGEDRSDAVLEDEVKLIWRRVKTLKWALFSLCASVLSSSLILVCSVLGILSGKSHYASGAFFLILSSALVGLAACFFMSDILQSTGALRNEARRSGLDL